MGCDTRRHGGHREGGVDLDALDESAQNGVAGGGGGLVWGVWFVGCGLWFMTCVWSVVSGMWFVVCGGDGMPEAMLTT